MKKWSPHPRGQGGQFHVNGPGSTVAASPVVDHAAQIPRGGSLAYPLAPTVEMFLSSFKRRLYMSSKEQT